MSRRDDDLSPFRDDPVFQALTGPAAPGELAGESEVLAAFRAANASRPMRRFAVRIGTSGAVAVVAVALSAGAAAAYTAELPASLQQIAHDAAGPIGVPAPKHHPHHPGPGGSKSPPLVAGPAPAVGPTGTAGAAAGGSPRPHLTPASVPSTLTPSPTITPTAPIVVTTPTSSSTPTLSSEPLLKGATLAVTTTASRVTVGTSLTVAGQLDAVDSTPIANRRVVLRQRLVGVAGWTRQQMQTTSSTGAVAFTVSPQRNLVLMLRIGRHVHSAVVKVIVLPTVSEVLASSETVPNSETVTVTVTGGQPGDVLGLNWFAGRKRHRQTVLDATGTATFTVQVPKHRTVDYRLFLRRTQAHAAAAGTFVLSPPQ